MAGYTVQEEAEKLVSYPLEMDQGILQCIVEKASVGDELFELFKSLTQESSLTVFGKIVENPRAVGGYELLLSQLKGS